MRKAEVIIFRCFHFFEKARFAMRTRANLRSAVPKILARTTQKTSCHMLARSLNLNGGEIANGGLCQECDDPLSRAGGVVDHVLGHRHRLYVG